MFSSWTIQDQDSMLPRGAILGGVAVVVVAFYCKLWNVQLLKEQDVLLQQLQQSYQPAQEPVLLMLGRGFFLITTAAWVVLSLQSLVAGIQLARYKPKVRQALQPLTPEEARQQHAQPDQQQGTSAAAQPATNSQGRTTAAAATKAAAIQAQQESQDWRDQRRRQALEARQKELDEQAAKLREQQAQEEAARQARKAQAAAEAARTKAEQEAAQAKAREEAEAKRAAAAAELARRREEFAAAARAQWHGLTPPQAVGGDEPSPSSSQGGSQQTSHQPGSGGGQPQPAYASDPGSLQDRQIRQQQDLEYQQSLERDRAKAAAKAAQRKAAAAALQQQDEQQRLAALRQSLLKELNPEPEESESTLTLRVRLPGGGQTIRRFSASQGFDQVFAWVYCLEDMPLWAPGTWALISAFPRRQLAPPSGSTWAPGAWAQQQAAQPGAQTLLPGEWMLQVKQLSEETLFVKVHEETTLEQVQADICAQTGAKADQQRLIFSGQLLQQPYRTLKQLGIGPDHTLQLAVRAASARGSDASSSDRATGDATGGEADASTAAAAAAAERARELAKAAEHAYLGSDVLVVSTVAELQEEVAHGASQLALYVEALQTQQS